ncbi:TonB-dependent receptor domain-containing protein [Lacinutrix salivirga]
MKVFTYIILFTLCSLLSVNAQEHSISGTLIDQNNEPVIYANVLLLKASEEGFTQHKGVSSNESGFFEFETIKAGKYRISASFLGYKTIIKDFNLSKNETFQLVLETDNEALEEVTITVNRPTLKKEVDRLVFNVANTSLSEGSMLEVLRSTPGVLVLGEEISIKNTTPTVFINDRKVHLSASELTQLLENSPANAIKKIEVITNPPAKYDAESGAVLHIVMSKNLITGYRGTVFTNYTQGVFPRYTAGINQFYKRKKVNINLNYNYSHSKINRENDEVINYTNNGIIDQIWNTNLNRNTTSKTHNANLNFDYFIDENNTLSITSNALVLPYFNYLTKGNTVVNDVESTNDDYSFNSNNLSNDNKYNLGIDVDFKHNLKNGSRLLLNTHVTKYDYDRNQHVNSDYLTANSTFDFDTAFKTRNDQRTEIFTSQLDYELPINDSSNFLAGIKSSKVNTESKIVQYDINTTTGELSLNTANTNAFDYDEAVFAAYVSYDKSWDKWSFSGGLRAEQTKTEGFSPTTNSTNKQEYLEWFPTLNLSYQAFENANLYTNFKRSISRPNYQSLNPFNYFLNDNIIVTGNPNLQPAITNHIVLGTEINSIYTIEAYYKKTKGDIHELPLQDNVNNVQIYSPTNIDIIKELGFDFITYFDVVDNWSVYFVTSFYNIQNEASFNIDNGISSNIEFLKTNQWSNYSVLSNDFSFLKDRSLSANFTLTYVGKNQQGFMEVGSRLVSDLSFSKKVLKNKGTLSLAFADLFNQQDFTVRSKYADQNSTNFTNLDNRYVKLGFSYKFGNTTLETNERTKERKERDRLNK